MLGTAYEAVTVESVAAEVGKLVAAVLSVTKSSYFCMESHTEDNNSHIYQQSHNHIWRAAVHILEKLTRGAAQTSGFGKEIKKKLLHSTCT